MRIGREAGREHSLRIGREAGRRHSLRIGKEAGRGHRLSIDRKAERRHRSRIGNEAGQRPHLEEWLRKKEERRQGEGEIKLEEGIKRNTGYGSDEYIEQGGNDQKEDKNVKRIRV